jgi:hypothetical protein
MSWKSFEESSPDLASIGYEKLNKVITYLALLNMDGSPRLHPVTPFIGNGMLFMFTEPTSPKIRDLRRDGRYAMHNAVSREGPLIEYLLSGNAKEISDPLVRAQAESIAAPAVITDKYVLFEFHIDSVLLVEYDENMVKVVRRWKKTESITPS